MSMPQLSTETMSAFVKRTFNAPREKVFRAWTEPEALKCWFGPEGFTLQSAEVDLRTGGSYRLAMKPANGDVYYHYGTYREIDPPEKLVFTWILEDQPCDGSENQDCETLVTVEFRDLGATTEVTLTHELLPTEQARAGHEFAWTASFDCLAAFVS